MHSVTNFFCHVISIFREHGFLPVENGKCIIGYPVADIDKSALVIELYGTWNMAVAKDEIVIVCSLQQAIGILQLVFLFMCLHLQVIVFMFGPQPAEEIGQSQTHIRV